jgi:hypothetical protein
MSESQKDIAYKIVLVLVIYFLIARPILQKLGILKDKSQRVIDEQAQLPQKQNPFSPNFYKFAPVGSKLITRQTAENLAKRLYDSFGYFSDDEAGIYSVFSTLRTQSQVSFLADVFSQVYKEDLLEFMKRGKGLMYQAGLSDAELSSVIDKVNRLPKYNY